MNRAGLALLACLASATLVRADATPASRRNNWFGVSIAVPTPGKHIGDHELGLRAGATFEGAAHPHVLVGAEIAYHRWPTTPEYMAAYDRYLRTWFRTFDSSTFAINALSLTGHVRLVAPAIAGHAPWVRLGAGLHRLDHSVAEPNWQGSTITVISGGPTNTTIVPGWLAGAGIDFRASPNVILGLNATYQRTVGDSRRTIWMDRMKMPDFSSLAIGTHVTLIRRP